MLVFVYGTLKKGHHNHGLLASSELVGVHVTPPAYTMYHLGGFPAVGICGQGEIKGEVYEVDSDTFRNLDWLEGYPDFYTRKLIDTSHGSAWMYYIEDCRQYSGSEIAAGEWV